MDKKMENLLTFDKSHFAMRFHVQATNHKRTYKNAVHTTLGNRNCERKGERTKVSFFIYQLLSCMGAFNDYVDTILTFFDHHLPLRGHF